MRLVGLVVAALVALPGGAGGDPAPASRFTAEQARSAVEEHIQEMLRQGGGIYRLPDAETGTTLELELVEVSIVSSGGLWSVHDPDRRIQGRSFFACVNFHPVGAPEGKLFDVDVLVKPRDGRLAVTEVRIHKEKHLVGGEWVWKVRAAPPAAAKGP